MWSLIPRGLALLLLLARPALVAAESVVERRMRNFGSPQQLRGFYRGSRGELISYSDEDDPLAKDSDSASLVNLDLPAYDIGDHNLDFGSGVESRAAIAVLGGSVEALDLLVQAGVDIDSPAPNGWTPLMFAARTGAPKMVEYILDHGANSRLLTPGASAESAYSIAVGADHRLVALMIADVSILQAMRADDSRAMMEMVRAGGNFNIANSAGWTPLIYMAAKGYADGVAELVHSFRADVNRVEGDGWTALMFASFYGNLEIVKTLVRAGANTAITSARVSPVSGRKLTALSVATFRNHAEVVRVLTNYRPVQGLRAKQFAIL